MTTLNSKGSARAAELINAGKVDKGDSWSFSADDGNALLGSSGEDWGEYSAWFLGEDTSATAKTKDRYKYPFGKGGQVYRAALVAIRSRSAQQEDESVFAEAGRLIDAIDKTDGKHYGTKAAAMRQRAFAKFEIKSIDDDLRIIEGIATTPTPDRLEDIVEPRGAVFDLPLPYLWQHDATQPIGQVTHAEVSDAGIYTRAQIAKVTEPGTLKDRIDEAWQSLKLKLVRGQSIGFAPLEYTFIEKTGGIHFTKWSWLELSGVTIPANLDASISVIKSLDAARVTKQRPIIHLPAPRAGELVITPRKHVPQADLGEVALSVDEEIRARLNAHVLKTG